MNKKLLTLVAAAGLAIGLTAVPASAAGTGPGSTIGSSCLDTNYGQLVSGARQAGHISGGVSGARTFVDGGLLAAHEAALCS
jgi:hypothetical protein